MADVGAYARGLERAGRAIANAEKVSVERQKEPLKSPEQQQG